MHRIFLHYCNFINGDHHRAKFQTINNSPNRKPGNLRNLLIRLHIIVRARGTPRYSLRSSSSSGELFVWSPWWFARWSPRTMRWSPSAVRWSRPSVWWTCCSSTRLDIIVSKCSITATIMLWDGLRSETVTKDLYSICRSAVTSCGMLLLSSRRFWGFLFSRQETWWKKDGDEMCTLNRYDPA